MPDDSQALLTKANAAERVLAELGADLAGHAADLEFSLRLRPQAIEPFGRFGCWLTQDFAPVGQALRRLGAPESVQSAQAASECPVRQGIAVAIGSGEFRLYLHGRDRATSRDTYSICTAATARPAATPIRRGAGTAQARCAARAMSSTFFPKRRKA